MSAPSHRYTDRLHDRIRRVTRFARQATHARAACAAATSTLLVLAITVDGGRGLDDVEALILAVLVGVLAFFTWTWTDRTTSLGIAKRADERLGLGGGLLAAYENAGRPERLMAELGARRTYGRAPFDRLRAAAVPPFELFLVLPLLGGVALFRAIEARDDARPTGNALVAQVSDLAANLKRSVAANSGALSEAQVAELTAAVGAAQDAAQAADEGPMGDAMRDVANVLDEAAASLPEGSPLADDLERLAFEAEAASVDSGLGDEDQVDPSVVEGDLDQELAAGPGAGGPAPDESWSAETTEAGRGATVEPAPPGGQAEDEGAARGPEAGADRPDVPDDGDPGDGDIGAGNSFVDQGPDSSASVADVPDLAEAPEPTTAAPAPWWPERDDSLVRAWLARIR